MAITPMRDVGDDGGGEGRPVVAAGWGVPSQTAEPMADVHSFPLLVPDQTFLAAASGGRQNPVRRDFDMVLLEELILILVYLVVLQKALIIYVI